MKLTRENLVDLFSTAFYGNDIMGVDYDREEWQKLPASQRVGTCFEDCIADMLLAGKTVDVIDVEQGAEESRVQKRVSDEYEGYSSVDVYSVSLEDIEEGCDVDMMSRELAGELFVEEEGDYFTAMNLMQYIVFGDIIYG